MLFDHSEVSPAACEPSSFRHALLPGYPARLARPADPAGWFLNLNLNPNLDLDPDLDPDPDLFPPASPVLFLFVQDSSGAEGRTDVLAPGKRGWPFSSLVLSPLATLPSYWPSRGQRLGSFSASIPQSFALSRNLHETNSRAIWLRLGAFLLPPAPFPEIHWPLTTGHWPRFRATRHHSEPPAKNWLRFPPQFRPRSP